MAKPSQNSDDHSYSTKKCPECYGYVPLKADVCPFCKTPLRGVGRHGMAERPTNWKAYIIAIVAWLVFIVYVKFAFF